MATGTKALDRKTYDAMKKRNMSTLQVFRMLQECGFTFSQRSLQNYIDTDFVSCPYDDVKKIIGHMMNNHDELIVKLKSMY